MNKISKNLLSFVFLVILMLPMFGFISIVQAAPELGTNYVEATGLVNTGDPREVAVKIIKVIMTFLGIIATVIILLGGFKWMTAAGNEDKVTEAKKLITAGIIGLIIILSAFMIVNWVINTTSSELLNT